MVRTLKLGKLGKAAASRNASLIMTGKAATSHNTVAVTRLDLTGKVVIPTEDIR